MERLRLTHLSLLPWGPLFLVILLVVRHELGKTAVLDALLVCSC